MRQLVLLVALYLAVVAEVGGFRLPGGFQFWWLDLVLLLAVQMVTGVNAILWCVVIGLCSDLLGHSVPGLGLLLGASLGFWVSRHQPEDSQPRSTLALVPLALGLAVWHVVTVPVSNELPWTSLPLVRSGFTLLFACLLQWRFSYAEHARQAELQQASRS